MHLRLPFYFLILSLMVTGAYAQAWTATGNAGIQCRAAIRAAEQAFGVPDQLLAAIGRVESGRRDSVTGQVTPWPWTINAGGQGYVFDTKAQAIAAVMALQAQNVRSIDVGCLQVNLMYHPEAFASLDAAFDPVTNATYAARFLTQLYSQTNDWNKAAANYHSATPEIGADYQRKVLAAWPEEKRVAGNPLPDPGPGRARSALANAWAATLPPGSSPPSPFGRFAVQLPGNRAEAARILPLPNGAGPGRSLDSYRSAPIFAISRPTRIGG
jgi:hypothetical protein